LIDAIWSPQGPPGQVVQFEAGDLPATLNTASSHDTDLPTALQMGRELGALLPETADIQVVAIYAQEVLTFGETPTPPVAAAIPHAAACVLALLGYSS
jgi:hydrogenase maturation protease